MTRRRRAELEDDEPRVNGTAIALREGAKSAVDYGVKGAMIGGGIAAVAALVPYMIPIANIPAGLVHLWQDWFPSTDASGAATGGTAGLMQKVFKGVGWGAGIGAAGGAAIGIVGSGEAIDRRKSEMAQQAMNRRMRDMQVRMQELQLEQQTRQVATRGYRGGMRPSYTPNLRGQRGMEIGEHG